MRVLLKFILCVVMLIGLCGCSNKEAPQLSELKYSSQEAWIGESKGITVICEDEKLASIEIKIINVDSDSTYSKTMGIDTTEKDGIYVFNFDLDDDVEPGFYQVKDVTLTNKQGKSSIYEPDMHNEETFEVKNREL